MAVIVPVNLSRIFIKDLEDNNTYLLNDYHIACVKDRRFSIRIRLNEQISYEPHHEKSRFFEYAKTKAQISFAVTAKLISAFVFATRIVQYHLYF